MADHADVGEFWTGRQRSIGGSTQGEFTAHLLGLRLDWSFTPQMFLNAFVQYHAANDTWLSNVRFNLIHRPLSDVYVVWNETRPAGETRRALFFKYTHLLAL